MAWHDILKSSLFIVFSFRRNSLPLYSYIRYEVSIFLWNFNLENCNPIVTIFKFNLSLTTFATLLFDNRWRRFIFFFVIECSMTIQNLFILKFSMTVTLRKKGCFAPQKNLRQISWLSDGNFEDWISVERHIIWENFRGKSIQQIWGL